jgi:hypothetical protein
MPVDRIPPSPSLLETMRALARDRARPADGSAPIATTATPQSAAPAHSLDALRQRLQPVLAQVDLSDAQSVVNARAPALHEILLWEFGPDFRRDPQFPSLAESIGGAMEADPRLQQQFVELIAGFQKVQR